MRYPRRRRLPLSLLYGTALLAGLAGGGLCEELTPGSLLAEAGNAAARSRDPQARALCLAEIAVAWAPIDRFLFEKNVQAAVECARWTDGPMEHALSLRSVARRVARVDKEAGLAILQEAIGVQEGLKFPIENAVALREIVAVGYEIGLPDADARAQAALDVAEKVEDLVARAACLRDLGTALMPYRPRLALEALRSSRMVVLSLPPEDAAEPLARAELAGAWAPLDLEMARSLVEPIEDEATRIVALGILARAVAVSNPDTALVVAQGIPEGPERAHVIAVSAVAIPPEMATAAASLGRVAAAMVAEKPGELAEATRAQAAIAMARGARDEAVSLARSITLQDPRAEALCGVADRVGETEPLRGVELLEGIDDPVASDPVIVRLATRVAALDPQAAVTLARRVVGRRQRVEALVGVAMAITPPQDKAQGDPAPTDTAPAQ